jgi:predicted O-linked N-acetylglucosamine transferase (SPINDLY family)
VNWLGFPGTMGTPFHHYIIADEWIIPPGSEVYYTEQVVRLPCYQSNDRKRTVAERPTRAAAGLPEDAFVFCCFNGSQKISRFTFERWMEILGRTPGSVLWLLSGDDDAAERLRRFAETRGVSRDRLIFAPKQANAWHLARYPLADLFLDTAPYGAHTTASDALFMGVPVLTLSGRSFAARVCGSLVRAAGLESLVCDTAAQYVERAIELAADPGQLRAYRDQLEANRASCTLFDMNKLVSHLEGLYRSMCEDYRAGRLPQPDLDGLEVYREVGLELDPELVETQTISDYHGLYLEKLARRHRFRPIKPDGRLWTAEAIAAAEGEATARPATRKAKPANPLSHAAE